MKILFVMRHPGAVRNFESTIRLLAERGHRVHLVLDTLDKGGNAGPMIALRDRYPGITFGQAPRREYDGWAAVAARLRWSIDYLRYLHPRYRGAYKLRGRAAESTPALVRIVARLPLVRTRLGLTLIDRLLRSFERAIPPSPAIDNFLREHEADVLMITPLIELGSEQGEYIRSAKGLGLPTALAVHSWDNLTNKGLIRDLPDLVTVWNEFQRQEAVELHSVPPERIAVTGAAAYDHWFTWEPGTSRDEFCLKAGLPDGRPFLLYLCSSSFIAPDEVAFVLDWVQRLRASSEPVFSEVGVLIRPHPQHLPPWQGVDVGALRGVSIWPRVGVGPVDNESKSDFFDSIHHSSAVVGVNTSALIESAIVGRPVYTMLDPRFADTQEGTLHFHHLLQANGGLLYVASSFHEHAAQLARGLRETDDYASRNRRFLEGFIRPGGLDVPAAPKMVAAIETLGAKRLYPARPPRWARPLRGLLAPLAAYGSRHDLLRRGPRSLRLP